MSFSQSPPVLGNQYQTDRVLKLYLEQVLPTNVLNNIESHLDEMGHLAGDELYFMQQADRLNEPVLTKWDAWGQRIDYIEISPLWQVAELVAVEHGVVSTAYQQTHGRFSRIYQFALAYLFTPSTDGYSCLLALTDGTARTLLQSGNQPLIKRAISHLTTRNPNEFWSSGLWMAEVTGGSDVGRSETVARQDEHGVWHLYGQKWFASSITSQVALTLARPEGNGPGRQGLALFYLETRDKEGKLRDIFINNLKDQLGIRKMPVAELTLDGPQAMLVKGKTNGIVHLMPMLTITYTWNAIMALSLMRRGLALARSYATKRVAFDGLLINKPLHLDVLATIQAEFEAAFHLTFFVVELIGLSEVDEIRVEQKLLLRLLPLILKLTTARQTVAMLSEVLESFGGNGYLEDTGLPALLRDGQALPIWQGTTNVLALEVLQFLKDAKYMAALKETVKRCVNPVRDVSLVEAGRMALAAVNKAESWLRQMLKGDTPTVELGARRLAMTLGRALALALLVKHAQWALEHKKDERPRAAARRFALAGVDYIQPIALADVRLLGEDGIMDNENSDK